MDIYLDHNATTPLDLEAASAMARFGRDLFANPSGLYPAAQAARAALEGARERLAACVGALADQVIFTSGGTEALHSALLSLSLAHRGGHLVTTAVEHAAVHATVEQLAQCGCSVTFVRPQRTGLVPAEAVAAALRTDTFLVAVQLANNELGTLQPTAAIAEVVRPTGAVFLVDAVQGLGKVPVDLRATGADLLALSAHKVGGPKGVGALVRRPGLELPVLVPGGGQEMGLRSGTENVAGCVGFAVAAERAVARQPQAARRWQVLRDELLQLTRLLPDTRYNGHDELTLANTVSLAFRGVDAVALTELLGRRGVAVSPGSACCAGRRSRVLEAIGLDEAAQRGTIRFSLGPDTSPLELRTAREQVVESVRELRATGGGCPLNGACRAV